jgi:hypothetical protein
MKTTDLNKSEIRSPEEFLKEDRKYLYSVVDFSSSSSSSSFSSRNTYRSIYY